MANDRKYLEQFKRFQSLLALALMVLALALMTDKFFTVDNSLNVLRQICANLCLSIGMTIIILSGGIDLSVGSMLALSGAVAAGLLKNGVVIPGIRLCFNEGAGTSIINEGSAGGNLIRSTPVPYWSSNAAPAVGGVAGVDFQTTSGNYYVESPTNYPQLAGLTKFTVAGWVNCRNSTEGSGGNRLVTWINHGGNGVDVVYKGDGSVQVGINQWPDSSPARSAAARITTDAHAGTNNWRFFAVTYDSTLASGHVKFYFGSNGSPATLDVAKDYSRGAVGANISRFCVGHFNVATRSGAQDRMFRGLIDEVQVFDKALSLEGVREVQAGTPRPPLKIHLDRLGAGWLLLTWTGANLILEEAIDATGPWTARSNQGGAQLIEPTGDSRFFRLRAP